MITKNGLSKRRITVISMIISIVAACSIMLVFAADGIEAGEVKIHNTRLVTSDLNATYIEGDIDTAEGQQIIVSDGFRTIVSKALPDTKEPAHFRVKIPAEDIKKDKMTLLYVKASDNGSVGLHPGERVELDYKERKDQKIEVDKKNYSLTFPGEEEKIKAKASSGEKVTYASSNPDVAKIKDDGTIVPLGGGKTTISIRQIGNGQYERAEETVEIDVTPIDAYTIVFHSSDDNNETVKQIIKTDAEEALKKNSFVNGNHEFLGWATEDGGLVKFDDGESVIDIAEKGGNVDLYAVWTGDGAAAAIAWAVKIANDDSFSYGQKPETSDVGCYFCGTNQINKPKGYEKTYVCLAFIGAAYAHGAEDPDILWADQHNKAPFLINDALFSKFSCWTKIGRCSNLSISDLEPGDVVVDWSDENGNDGHVWMYIGDDNFVDSEGLGWGADSIAVRPGASKELSYYGRDGRNFVARYTGVNAQ